MFPLFMAQFQLSEDEYIRGSLAFVLKPRTVILLTIALIFFVLSEFFHGQSLIHSIGVTLGCAVLFGGLVYFLVRRRLKKIFHEQQSLQELINVTIDDQQLNYSWVRGSYVLPWENVRSGRETQNFFILWESSAFGRILPKRALSEEEKTIIRKNIASRRTI